MRLFGLMMICMLSLMASGCTAEPLEGASWHMETTGPVSNGLQALTGADGVTETATRGGQTCLTVKPGTGSQYIYFRVNDARLQDVKGPLYLVIEYYDEALGPGLEMEYDSATGDDLPAQYHSADAQSGGFLTASYSWRRAIFVVKQPRFAHRENLHADIRVKCRRLFLRSLQMTYMRPADYDQLDHIDTSAIKPLVKIGEGGQLIVGGFDPSRLSDVAPQTHALEAAMPAFKQLGVTSNETYVRWNLCETAPGKFDWSVYDTYVDIYKRHGLKWVPFLICGSAYSLPDWYYKQPGSQGYVCLEHGQESDVQSLWNPTLRAHVASFIKAFCDHYGPTGIIESILLGVTGNYGEAIYPASGNDWTSDIHGQYHTHTGYWAGDPYAVAKFREWLKSKYQDNEHLQAAWGTHTVDLATVQPFIHEKRPGERAWLDFVDWYTASMTEYADFWLKTTRDAFPKGDIYLCTGGDAPPEHGASFGDQCKAAAKYGAGVRITNDGSDYRANFAITRWVGSAARQYNAYFSFEPAGNVDEHGVVARVYNATSQGARGLHYYFPNLFDSETARDSFIQVGAQFQQQASTVEIAVFYPETWVRLVGQRFVDVVQPLRDRFDFDYKSDTQIVDGGLKSVKALILLQGNIADSATWQAIGDWVRAGGLLLYADGMGNLSTPDGDETPTLLLSRGGASVGSGRIQIFHGDNKGADYRDFLTDTLRTAPELSPDTRAMIAADGKEDGVYVTLFPDHHLFWLNYTDKAVTRNGAQLAPYSIGTTALPP